MTHGQLVTGTMESLMLSICSHSVVFTEVRNFPDVRTSQVSEPELLSEFKLEQNSQSF